MNNPGGNQGGAGAQQGGGQAGSSKPTSNSADTSTFTTAITTATATATPTAAPTSTSSSNPASSSTTTLSNNRTIIIGSTVGGVAGLLSVIFFLIWLFNRRSKTKARKQQGAATNKENQPLPNSAAVPVSYTALNREFSGVPFSRPENSWNNPDELSPQPLFARNEALANNAPPAIPTLSARRNLRSQTIGIGNRERDIEGEMYPNSQDDLLPPTYAESQSDALSMRVLTPQYPQPSAFLDRSAARIAGFLSPQHSGIHGLEPPPSPSSSQPYSPDSLNTEFYHRYGTEPYQQDGSENGSGNGNGGIRMETSIRDSSTLGYVSPLEPLEPPRLPGAIMESQQHLRVATDSLENLVRGPGGLLGRSASGRTVSSFASVSAVSADEDVRGGNERGNADGRVGLGSMRRGMI